MNVIASFSAGAREYCDTVQDILHENDVKFYSDHDISTLIGEIRATAHEFPAMSLLGDTE